MHVTAHRTDAGSNLEHQVLALNCETAVEFVSGPLCRSDIAGQSDNIDQNTYCQMGSRNDGGATMIQTEPNF